MIELKDVSVRREGRILFSDVNLALHRNQKIGLTGKNGAGKSTLFAVLLGEYGVDTGQCRLPSDWQVAHMAQEVAASEQTALDYVLSGDDVWYELNAKLSVEHTLTGEEIAALHAQFDAIDGYRVPARAAQILSGLGFCQAEHQKSVATFSGGWRMRLNLARTLMHRAEVLLLDEPTNHLDLDAILWLEEWLGAFDGLVMVISHDKSFLDAVVGHILHIEQGKMTLYTGNYSQFERIRAERLAQEQHAFEEQQATRAHLEDYIRRFRAKATKARQAQSRIKQLERMTELAPVMADSVFSFEFYEPSAMSSPLIHLENASIGYDKPLIDKVTLQITPETRLGILGANGAGKSTLIKALVGELDLLSGTCSHSQNLALGYFNQHQLDALDLSATPLLLLRRLAGQTSDVALRAFLGSFGFRGDDIETPVASFSGGERARLTLALIVWQRPNVLVLDEPTNHLDLQMRDALMLALQNFSGAVVLVSHDRELMLSVCDELLLVAQGRAKVFEGDMIEYADHLKRVRQERQKTEHEVLNDAAKGGQKLSKEDVRKKNAILRQTLAPLRKEIAKLEQTVDNLNKQLKHIEEKLSDTAVYEDANKAALLALLNEQSVLKTTLANEEDALLLKMDELETLESELSL
ncbi:MAG: ATP-binding cassette domain-containing protein [Moraxella sp.]|nr:ATP-binding cassette domain-containing protein [Moraxella sp.]